MTVRVAGIPAPVTSRVTTDHSASRPDERYGGNHSPSQPIASRSSGGDRHVRAPNIQGVRCRPGWRNGRRLRRSGSAGAGVPFLGSPLVFADWVRSACHVPIVEIGLHAAGGGDQLRIARDRPRQPIHVGRLELRDLAEGVAAELPELELVRSRSLDRRQRRRPEVPNTVALQRPARMAGAGRFSLLGRPAVRRLPAESGPRARWAFVGFPCGVAKRRVARPERTGEVEAAGDRPSRPGLGRPASSRGRAGLERCSRGTARRRAGFGVARPRHRGVGLVDLRHAARSDPGRLGVVAGQVRVVLPSELPPRRLDLGSGRSRLDPKDDVGLAFRHDPSVSPAFESSMPVATLDSRRAVPCT